MRTTTFTLTPEDNTQLNYFCGPTDQNLLTIERFLAVGINHRGHDFNISGPDDSVDQAEQFIKDGYNKSKKHPFTPEELNLTLQSFLNQITEKNKGKEDTKLDENFYIQTHKKKILPRGNNQGRYIKRMQELDVNFGIGPAGTGKTYLAIAQAVQALEEERVKKLILTRPAVEAGEKLGFLPGDLSQKVDPYLRPMYDALYELMGVDKINMMIEQTAYRNRPTCIYARQNIK